MSIVLYKKGTSHVINGITCEQAVVSEYGFEGMLNAGWYFSPEEVLEAEKAEKAEKTRQTVKTEVPKKAKERKAAVEEKLAAMGKNKK